MLLDFSVEQLRHISNTSLWIIMDPWKDQQLMLDGTDTKSYELPINQWNDIYMQKIFKHMQIMKNKIVVIDDIKKSPNFLKTSLWISHGNSNGFSILNNFMRERNLDSIIYCGFHEQMCIVNRPLGYNNMLSRYNCYIEQNLTCPFPTQNWKEEQLRQRTDKEYKYIDMLSIEKQ